MKCRTPHVRQNVAAPATSAPSVESNTSLPAYEQKAHSTTKVTDETSSKRAAMQSFPVIHSPLPSTQISEIHDHFTRFSGSENIDIPVNGSKGISEEAGVEKSDNMSGINEKYTSGTRLKSLTDTNEGSKSSVATRLQSALGDGEKSLRSSGRKSSSERRNFPRSGGNDSISSSIDGASHGGLLNGLERPPMMLRSNSTSCTTPVGNRDLNGNGSAGSSSEQRGEKGIAAVEKISNNTDGGKQSDVLQLKTRKLRHQQQKQYRLIPHIHDSAAQALKISDSIPTSSHSTPTNMLASSVFNEGDTLQLTPVTAPDQLRPKSKSADVQQNLGYLPANRTRAFSIESSGSGLDASVGDNSSTPSSRLPSALSGTPSKTSVNLQKNGMTLTSPRTMFPISDANNASVEHVTMVAHRALPGAKIFSLNVKHEGSSSTLGNGTTKLEQDHIGGIAPERLAYLQSLDNSMYGANENDRIVQERLQEAKALNRKDAEGAVMHKFSLWSKCDDTKNSNKDSVDSTVKQLSTVVPTISLQNEIIVSDGNAQDRTKSPPNLHADRSTDRFLSKGKTVGNAGADLPHLRSSEKLKKPNHLKALDGNDGEIERKRRGKKNMRSNKVMKVPSLEGVPPLVNGVETGSNGNSRPTSLRKEHINALITQGSVHQSGVTSTSAKTSETSSSFGATKDRSYSSDNDGFFPSMQGENFADEGNIASDCNGQNVLEKVFFDDVRGVKESSHHGTSAKGIVERDQHRIEELPKHRQQVDKMTESYFSDDFEDYSEHAQITSGNLKLSSKDQYIGRSASGENSVHSKGMANLLRNRVVDAKQIISGTTSSAGEGGRKMKMTIPVGSECTISDKATTIVENADDGTVTVSIVSSVADMADDDRDDENDIEECADILAAVSVVPSRSNDDDENDFEEINEESKDYDDIEYSTLLAKEDGFHDDDSNGSIKEDEELQKCGGGHMSPMKARKISSSALSEDWDDYEERKAHVSFTQHEQPSFASTFSGTSVQNTSLGPDFSSEQIKGNISLSEDHGSVHLQMSQSGPAAFASLTASNLAAVSGAAVVPTSSDLPKSIIKMRLSADLARSAADSSRAPSVTASDSDLPAYASSTASGYRNPFSIQGAAAINKQAVAEGRNPFAVKAMDYPNSQQLQKLESTQSDRSDAAIGKDSLRQKDKNQSQKKASSRKHARIVGKLDTQQALNRAEKNSEEQDSARGGTAQQSTMTSRSVTSARRVHSAIRDFHPISARDNDDRTAIHSNSKIAAESNSRNQRRSKYHTLKNLRERKQDLNSNGNQLAAVVREIKSPIKKPQSSLRSAELPADGNRSDAGSPALSEMSDLEDDDDRKSFQTANHLPENALQEQAHNQGLAIMNCARIDKQQHEKETHYSNMAIAVATAAAAIAGASADAALQEELSPLRWKKGEAIGEGTYGKVFKGLNEKTGELLAIKQLCLADGTDSEVESLQREIMVMWNLDHENIVRYRGTSRSERYLYIVLEYVTGGSIASMISQFGAFSESLIRRLTYHIVSGVEYLHSKGIIHRDIKGANILVTDAGVAKLSDFGCSKQLAGMCTASMEESLKTIRGSVPWMAPEVIKQSGHGRSSDIWSVGATMIEMATGKPPWSEFSNNLAALFHVATSKVPPHTPPHVSKACATCIERCLQYEQSNRATATELLKDTDFLFTFYQPKNRQHGTSDSSSNPLDATSTHEADGEEKDLK